MMTMANAKTTMALRGALRQYAQSYQHTNGHLLCTERARRFGIEWWDAQGLDDDPAHRMNRVLAELRREGYIA